MNLNMTRRARLAASFAAVLLLAPMIPAQEKKEEPPPKGRPAAKGKASTSKAAPQQSGPQTPASRGPAPARGPEAGPASRGPEGGAERTNVGPGRGPGAPAPSAAINRGGPAGARPLPQGARVVQTRGGGAVTMRANGRPAVVHTANGMDVHHSLTGRTEVIRESPDHSRVVAVRGGFGYVQRPYTFGGHPYLARTYLVGGRPYESFYRGYPYHGLYLEVYAPVRFYPLGFYGYVGTPWVRPVPYTWGWVGTPWFTFYGGFFTPYPVYAGPPLWLTDYLIAQSLNAAYQAQMAQAAAAQGAAQGAGYPPPPAGGPVALTPDVKQAIADEVSRQLAQENAEARLNAQGMDPDPNSSSIARMLSDGTPHTFVVGDGLDLLSTAGQECAVTEGDVLQLAGPTPPDAPSATLIVMASKGGVECRKGSSVTVQLTDLQDMQNHMRQTLDAGLAELQSHQGGLPTPPPTALAMATPAAFSMGAPPPDPTVATQINAQLQQGTQAEQQTLAEAGSGLAPGSSAPAATAAPATVTLGQSIDQVTAILGQPTQVVDLGAKKIYVYPSLKVTFNNGQVADVE
jgi:hypothetical protein